jgi:hypothetical protein
MGSVFTSMGSNAAIAAKKTPMKFIKLENGKSIRVRVATNHDVAEYLAHSDFNLKIFPTPCIAVMGEDCPLCMAAKAGIEGFDRLYTKQRYMFFFYDLDAEAFLPFDATKQQAKDILSTIRDYADSLDAVAFNFKRTGTATATKYTLSPILRMSADDKAKFEAMPAEGVTPKMFEDAISIRPAAQMIADLAKAEFPVDKFFDVGGDDSPANDIPA